MTTKDRLGRLLAAGLATVGITFGAAAIANAATGPQPPAQPSQTSANPSDHLSNGDEAIDGVDHQFEGEEIGNNGDGIPDPNEANEVEHPEMPEAQEVATPAVNR